MDDREKKTRYHLTRTLGDLAESIIRRVPPFDRVEFQPEVLSNLHGKYIEYSDEIESSMKQRILLMLIDSARWEIKNTIIGGSKSFESIYPEHLETEKIFKEWIIEKECKQIKSTDISVYATAKGIKINRIIRKVVKERFPDFKYGKIKNMPEIMPFAMSIFDGNRVYLVVDKDIRRKCLEFMIGINYPRFYFNPSILFSNTQSAYKYNTEKEANDAVNKALDVIDVILPHLLTRLREALEKFGNAPQQRAHGE